MNSYTFPSCGCGHPATCTSARAEQAEYFPTRPMLAQHSPSSEETAVAFNLGAGRPMAQATDAERRQFEAWMAGHNWQCAPWDGKQYTDVFSRTTWAAWRDRAELARAEQEEPMPPWLSYEPSQDVLTINGKRYSAALFGVEGFLAPAGTCLRIVDGPNEVVTAEEIPPAAPVAKLEPWQPIETAPKDGPILVYENGFFDVVYWEDVGEWRSHYETIEPSHWMQLPPPPGEAARNAKLGGAG